jgi:hypothetical protein
LSLALAHVAPTGGRSFIPSKHIPPGWNRRTRELCSLAHGQFAKSILAFFPRHAPVRLACRWLSTKVEEKLNVVMPSQIFFDL